MMRLKLYDSLFLLYDENVAWSQFACISLTLMGLKKSKADEGLSLPAIWKFRGLQTLLLIRNIKKYIIIINLDNISFISIKSFGRL